MSGRKIPAGSYLNFDSGYGKQTKWMTGKIRLKKGELLSINFECSTRRMTCTVKIS